ncbi:MAG: hypothetical protein J6J00_11790 [Treponema sp.]|nr:hypothetical protein [Treponema sp.]
MKYKHFVNLLVIPALFLFACSNPTSSVSLEEKSEGEEQKQEQEQENSEVSVPNSTPSENEWTFIIEENIDLLVGTWTRTFIEDGIPETDTLIIYADYNSCITKVADYSNSSFTSEQLYEYVDLFQNEGATATYNPERNIITAVISFSRDEFISELLHPDIKCQINANRTVLKFYNPNYNKWAEYTKVQDSGQLIPVPNENDNSLESLGKYTELSSIAFSSVHITNEDGETIINNASYISFGTFPQTIKASNVIIDESTIIIQGGQSYYLGSDNYWYAKVTAKTTDNPVFTDGSNVNSGTEYYFKVEPIIWRVLTDNYSGKKLLLAESILTANILYYGNYEQRQLDGKSIYANNYNYSNVRAYLNGEKNQFVTDGGTATEYDIDWSEKGFLQIAFTANQQKKIAETIVDDTNDKIFLLSTEELKTRDYGFTASDDESYTGQTHSRQRIPTDYALANGCSEKIGSYYGNSTFGCWWTRTPASTSSYVHDVYWNGNTGHSYGVGDYFVGIVPALCVTE